MKKKIVIAGLGDTGLLVALNLNNKHPGLYDITGISSKPCLVSGQELGTRLARPKDWKEKYLVDFKRFRKFQAVNHIHGTLLAVDTQQQSVKIESNGEQQSLPYDVLVISSGVSNGFWRNNKLQNKQQIEADIEQKSQQLSQANSIAVIGGGPSGVSTASNLKEQYPQKDITLYFSREHILPGYHPKAVNTVEQQLKNRGVKLQAGHRAIFPEGFDFSDFTDDEIHWQTGQAAAKADLVIWATGQLKPNSDYLPQEMLEQDGFVKANQYLQVPGFNNVFTVGDIANSDPNRSSARNAGFLTVANNIHALLQGKPLKTYKASQYRWGSILGVQNEGMRVFTPSGGNVRVPPWLVRTVLFPFFVWKVIYKGRD